MTLRRLIISLLPALAVGLLTSAGPAVAADWSPPQNISASANDLASSELAVDRTGRAFAAWPTFRWQSGTSHGHYVAGGWQSATRAPGGSAFVLPRSAPSYIAGPVLYGVSRTVGLDRRLLGRTRCGERSTVRARFGTSSGDVGSLMTIATATAPGGDRGPAVSANDAGIVVAAWTAASDDCRRSAVRVALRRPGASRFEAPVTLRGSGLPQSASVAIGAGGDILVAWARRVGEGRTAIEARVRPAGRGWGPVSALGAGTVAGPLTTAVAQNGRSYVAWGTQSISESTGLAADVLVAVRPAGTGAFRAAQTLERVRTGVAYLPRLGPVLALAGTNAVIAWTGHDSAWRVRAASTDASGRFGPAQSVSPPESGAVLGDLAALPDGTAAVAWSGLDGENLVRDVAAAVRPAGGVFGAPEQVSTGALRLPSVALDPTTRRPTVTWAQRLGPVTSVATITAYVRASTRTQAP